MLITGVMPLPAVMNSGRTGMRVGQHELALRQAERDSTRPARARARGGCDTRPPGRALTVIAMQLAAPRVLGRGADRVGADVPRAGDGHGQRDVLPGAMAAPAAAGAQGQVRASGVSSQTFSTRARSRCDAQSGFTSSR